MIQTLLLTTLVLCGADAVEATRAFRRVHGAEIIEEFAVLLSTPNVADDGPNIRRNAEYLAQAFRARGVDIAVHELPGAPPLVVGQLKVPGATRTIGIYAHYDGQPVDPERWSNPPWTPTLYTAAIEAAGVRRPWPGAAEPIDPAWRLYARGAGHDQAPTRASPCAPDAFRAARCAPTSHSTLPLGAAPSGPTNNDRPSTPPPARVFLDLFATPSHAHCERRAGPPENGR